MFQGKAALPKHSSIESAATPKAEEEIRLLVQRSDIIYFPTEYLIRTSGYERARRLLQALKASGSSLIVGWDSLDADQQPALDALRNANPEASAAAIAWNADDKVVGSYRSLLRDSFTAAQLALHLPRLLAEKLRDGQSLTREEQETLPTEFKTPPADLQSLYEHLPAGSHLNEGELPRLYHAWLSANQFAAAKIIHELENSSGKKALIFMKRRELEGDIAVPQFVAQKISLRQLVLEIKLPSRDDAHVLALADAGSPGRHTNVVDCAPRAGRH